MAVLECIMVVMMAGMLILVGTNVMLRIFANSGIDFAEEVPRFMFVWLIFCGAVVAMKERTHISVNLLVLMAPKPVQKLLYGIGECLILLCGVYITYGTIKLHTIVYENTTPVLQISTLWVYGVTYICGPGLVLISLSNLARLMLGKGPDAELKGRDDVLEEATETLHEVSARGEKQ